MICNLSFLDLIWNMSSSSIWFSSYATLKPFLILVWKASYIFCCGGWGEADFSQSWYHEDRKWWVSKQHKVVKLSVRGLSLWRFVVLTQQVSDWPSPRGHTCMLAELLVSVSAMHGLVSVSPLTSITEHRNVSHIHWGYSCLNCWKWICGKISVMAVQSEYIRE